MDWKCPVCGKTEPRQPEVCSDCGYDESTDREKYPTLSSLIENVRSRSGKIRQWEEFHRQKGREEQERRECQLQEQQEKQELGERLKWKQEEFLSEPQEQNVDNPVYLQFSGGTFYPQREGEVKAKKSLREQIWNVIAAVGFVLIMVLIVVLILGFNLPFQVEGREMKGGIYTGTAIFFGFSPKEGQMLYPNGNAYEGKWNIRPHGYGAYTLADGTRYEGEWKQGKLIEKTTKDNNIKLYQGIYVLPDGAAYVGTWTEIWFSWNRTGQGTMYDTDNRVYTGEWQNDMRNGQGTLTWPNGDRYEGDFVDDARTGYGVYTWSDGTRYEGNFVNNEIIGQGTMYYTDGSVYMGEWKNNMRNGQGILAWANGDRYEGDFVDDARTGYGVYTWSDGTRYEGAFVNNEIIG